MSAPIALGTIACLRVEVAPPLGLGELDGLERRVVTIAGGTVEGPHFRGIILPGGSDMQTVQADGTINLVARYVLELDDFGKVLVENTGIRRAPAADAAEAPPYFRGVMRFQAPRGPLGWLNQSVFITSGKRDGSIVQIDVAQVL
jgi:hypothetical protein